MCMMRLLAPLLVLAAIVLAGCSGQGKESAMRQALAEANYCETTDDCAMITGVCPFDCYVLMNKAQSGAIMAKLSTYETNCTYSCMRAPAYECTEKKCEFVRSSSG